MRPSPALFWMALVLGLLCKLATASAGAKGVMLYSDSFQNDALVEVKHQRALAQTASPPPGYTCAQRTVASSINVRIQLNVRAVIDVKKKRVKALASFAAGKNVLTSTINSVYSTYKRPAFAADSITGPGGQAPSIAPKWFTFTFTLPIGPCGDDKSRLIRALRRALVALDGQKKVKGSRTGGAKLSSFK